MSRYIEADALIESVCHTADLGGWIGDTLRNIKRLAVRYINETPSIDIVRCKECYMCDEEMWCSFYDSIMEPDDFCSYGEREGE